MDLSFNLIITYLRYFTIFKLNFDGPLDFHFEVIRWSSNNSNSLFSDSSLINPRVVSKSILLDMHFIFFISTSILKNHIASDYLFF